jgi:hypothetical protein
MTYPITVPEWKIYQGDTFSVEYVFKNETTGLPINLVTQGWASWTCQWRPYRDSENYLNLTVSSTNAATGVIAISAEPDITSQMTVDGVWDLQAVSTSGTVCTFLTSTAPTTEDVTR